MPRIEHQRLRRVAVAALLLAPTAGLLWVPWYAGASPRLTGTPFFYWYQLAWVPGSALCLLAAYALTRKDGRDP
ncbi:DUF3311 domain-containing protein [Streptomyces sp. ME02-8801-2C]|uniref:DUF3311 domain-containing protein n=1 Tax=Streptomyces sp. ME02-8801-2C TaxID=3028680 RepID=UPI0029B27A99|nr:DUF3311 domain-containing protein [Streptomyces sp. ME02-8801-2C]MDX3452409.1 DUF3311 domain-containing protein [Streptomyces sp. ME02-8801-2C]